MEKLKLLWLAPQVQFRGKGIVTAWGEQMILKGWKLVTELPCDLAFFGSDSQLEGREALVGQVPSIVYFWGWPPWRLLEPAFRQFAEARLGVMARCTRILVPSPTVQDQCFNFGLPAFMCDPGVDTTIPSPGDARIEQRVVFISRLAPHKNLHLLMQAISLMERRVPLLVIGPGDSEPYQQLASQLGVQVEFQEPDDAQKVFELRRSIVLVHPSQYEGFGLPPCFPPETPVDTKQGIKPIRAIVEGDEVLTHQGTVNLVEKVIRRQVINEPACRLRLHGGHVLEVTANHPLLAVRRDGRLLRKLKRPGQEAHWIQAGNLKKGDFLFMPKPCPEPEPSVLDMTQYTNGWGSKFSNHGNRVVTSRQVAKAASVSSTVAQLVLRGRALGQVTIPTIARVWKAAADLGWKPIVPVPSSLPLTPEFGRFLGFYIAEGSTGRNGQIEFDFHAKERDYCQEVLHFFKETLRLPASFTTKGNQARVTANFSSLAKALNNLCGKGAKNKRLPLVSAAGPFSEGLLQGLWRGDGYTNSHYLAYTTASPLLAIQVKRLLMAFGFLPSLKVRDGGKSWTLTVSGKQSHALRKLLNFPTERRGKRTGQDFIATPEGFFVPIRDTTPFLTSGEVWNLDVREEHSYCVNGVAAHNCEALYNGVPVVALDTPHMRYLLQEDAYYFSSLQGLAGLLDHIIRRDPREALDRAYRGKKRVENYYTLPHACDRLWAHIHQTIKEHLAQQLREKPAEWARIYDDEHRRNWAYSIDRFDPTWERHWRSTTFIDLLKECRAKKILDVGCGAVYPTIFARAGFEVTALDISEECLNQACLVAEKWGVRHKMEPLLADAMNLGEIPDGSFDAVVQGEIWEHIAYPRKVIEEGLRVLKTGGYLIATTPIGHSHWDPMHMGPVEGGWDDATLKELLRPWEGQVKRLEKIAEEGTEPSCFLVVIQKEVSLEDQGQI